MVKANHMAFVRWSNKVTLKRSMQDKAIYHSGDLADVKETALGEKQVKQGKRKRADRDVKSPGRALN